MILFTFKPAIFPASFVACLWESLKYAGTVMTASSTFSPKYSSAICFAFCNIIALISGGEYFLLFMLTRTSPLDPFSTLKGTSCISWSTSSYMRPINLLILDMVLVGFVIACLFALVPTNLSPSFLNAIIDGVVLPPSEFNNIFGSLPSIIATHELVVPKSIPIIFPIFFSILF